MNTIRVYVTAPEGRELYGFGSRLMGEFFDLPEEVAFDLMDKPGFSHVAPGAEAPADEPEVVKEPSEKPRTHRKGN